MPCEVELGHQTTMIEANRYPTWRPAMVITRADGVGEGVAADHDALGEALARATRVEGWTRMPPWWSASCA